MIAGAVSNVGWGQEPGTVMVMVGVEALPQGFETLNQYDVVVVMPGVLNVGDVGPTGFEVSPLWPWYHWNVRGLLPVMPPR